MLSPLCLTGSSLALREIDDEATHIAPFDIRVLITGESGVGKQSIARLIHQRSPRADRPFVTVDCGIVADLAFKSEWLAPLSAAGGTLFLRGAEDMSPGQQAVLHRYLDGVCHDDASPRSRLRVLAGSRMNLFEAVEAGTFRRDLFYRLNTVHICVPPLRERTEDIPVLFDHFVRQVSDIRQCAHPHIARETRQALLEYSWPDNVRELRQVAERLVMKGGDPRGEERMLARQVQFESMRSKRPVHAFPADVTVINTPRPRLGARPRTTP
jgi:DNA-binding NtrC family response regulator